MKSIYLISIFSLVIGYISHIPSGKDNNTPTGITMMDPSLTKIEYLGKLLFIESTLSTPPGESCSTCHDPEAGFGNPDKSLPVSKGAIPGHFGNRNDMTVAYSAYTPPLQYDKKEGVWFGGLFWDGRANSLAEQAQGPPLNILEMANPSVNAIAEKLRALEYASLFNEIFGPDALSNPDSAFRYMAEAIAAYERTKEVNSFSSKYDHWLRGEAKLTYSELQGLKIFEAPDKGNCIACHPCHIADDGTFPLFSDHTFDNLGVPPNPENPFYILPPELNPDGMKFVDLGLGSVVKDPAENGKFRVPTLRNVAITGPYMHNGIFKTLFQVVTFYNTRDVATWPDPEVPENVNKEELGNLKLTNQELEDLVAFLNTLTDGWSQ
jgi:cytochrome c peroxidase